MISQELTNLGLSEKEAKVYLSALELGPTSIQNLTRKSGIKRSTVYEMIKNLEVKKLISETVSGKRKIYIAASPENLKRQIHEQEKLLNQLLPELRAISNTGFAKPKIMFYEGKEGVREIYRDTLNSKSKKAYWVSPIQSMYDTIGEDFLVKNVEDRIKKKIWIKSIHVTTKNVSSYKFLQPENYENSYRAIKFTPTGINFENTIAIYDNRVAVISSKREGFGFIIESEDYADTMKTFYDLLWQICIPYSEKFKEMVG